MIAAGVQKVNVRKRNSAETARAVASRQVTLTKTHMRRISSGWPPSGSDSSPNHWSVIRGISYQQSVFSRQLNLVNDTVWRYQFTHIRLFVEAVREPPALWFLFAA